MARYTPGDVVRHCEQYWEGVIACEPDPLLCMICTPADNHDGHVEWANVLDDHGIWHWHVPECSLELSGFGASLRGPGLLG